MTGILFLLAVALPARLRAPDLILVLLYLAGITLFGLRFRDRDRSLRSYFLADRNVPWWAIALSIVSAETSTLTIISIPGVAFAGDFGFLQLVFGYMLGRIVLCILFLPKYFQGELFTAYQLIDRRFGAGLHKVTAFLFLITRAAAEGVRVFAVSIVVGIAIGTGNVLSIAIISALTLAYTFEGGMTAVIWTDVVQMLIYIGGTLVALFTLGHHVQGGWSGIHATAGAAGKFHLFHFALNLTTTYTFWAGIIGGTFLTMASHGTDQLMVQRLLAAKNLRESRMALLGSGFVVLVQFTLFLLIGAGLFVFYGQHPATFTSNDSIFPSFIVQQMPIGISGLLVAAILAAAMSNLSAALNSLSSTTVVDFYLQLRPSANDRERNRISRLSTVFWALVLFALAVYSYYVGGKGHVVETGLAIASVAYGSLLGVFLLGTLTRTANQTGSIIGMVIGFAFNLTLWILALRHQNILLHLFGKIFLLKPVAYTWYVFLGAVVTFTVGYLCSMAFKASARRVATATLFIAIFATTLHPALIAQTSAPPPAFAPTASGFAAIDQIMAEALREHQMPGAVISIGHGGNVVFHKAYGDRSLVPAVEPMTEDTIFDMASLTKCLATATALMQLYERGLYQFDDPVQKYLPGFTGDKKNLVTIRMLLTHYSGEPPDTDLKDANGNDWTGKEYGIQQHLTWPLAAQPGSGFKYSDINFVVLGLLVEKLSSEPLDQYALHHIFAPLGMEHTRFLPPAEWLPLIAPTEYDENGKILRGVVHDPRSRRMGGVAGHAGVFSTAADMCLFAQALLDRLAGRPSKFPLQQSTLQLMTTPEQPGHGPASNKNLRGFGWDINTGYSGPRGTIFPVGSFGHTGFTGTSVWMDPGSDTYVVMLANAVHPHTGPAITRWRGMVATAAARALHLYETPAGAKHTVLNGIDVLEADHFSELKDLTAQHGGHLRLGLLTNQNGLDKKGRRTIDVLAKDAVATVPGLALKMLFSPEHGITGAADSTNVSSATDPATGLPVVSLYGATDAQRRPPLDKLAILDAVIIDLQDAGVRFYTYETLTGYFVEAAAKAKVALVVLDRPDIINGLEVEGPVSDAGLESYTDYMPLPVRPGLTLGELARYINSERNLNTDLTVIGMRGWQRGDWFDNTDLTWTNPSPNLRSITAAALYPGIGMFETTNVSVGRGTATPFEHFGAPWIKGATLAALLNAHNIAGVRFEATKFTPEKPYPYAGQLCEGIHIILVDRGKLDATAMGIDIIATLHTLWPREFQMQKAQTLIVNADAMKSLADGVEPSSISAAWQPAVWAFAQHTVTYHLY